MSLLLFYIRRELRNLRDFINYIVRKKRIGRPDNHYYKVSRILKIAKKNSCNTLIETGTFYGQTIQKCNNHFEKTFSVELHEELFEFNKKWFKKNNKVLLFKGDSASRLRDMIDQSVGKNLFWLDGHFSGTGTAIGIKVSPILEELEIIKKSGRKHDCILIDDIRLFNGQDGYPTIEMTKTKILEINSDYKIHFDSDCLIAEI